MSGHHARVGLLVVLLWLAACSRDRSQPPEGLAGMRLGDAPAADFVAVPVPLPSELVGKLVYYTAPQRTSRFRGVLLAKPVYAFYRNGLVSVMAEVQNPGEAPRLRRELEHDYGSPMCRQTPAGDSCLWRVGPVDLVLATDGSGQARVLLRSNTLAKEVLGWRDQPVALEHDGENTP